MEILQAYVKRSSKRPRHALHHFALELFSKAPSHFIGLIRSRGSSLSKTNPRRCRYAGMALHRESAATNHAGVIRFVVLSVEKLQEVVRISQGRVSCPFHLDGSGLSGTFDDEIDLRAVLGAQVAEWALNRLFKQLTLGVFNYEAMRETRVTLLSSLRRRAFF